MGGSSLRKSPAVDHSRESMIGIGTPLSRELFYEHFDTAVFGPSCRRIVAGNWIALSVTGSREVGYTAIP